MSSASSSALSGALKALAGNPSDFLTKNAIVFSPVSVPPVYRSDDGSSFRSGKAGVKLVQSLTAITTYNLQFVAIKDLPTDKEAIDAFVLAYKNDNGNDDVPFVDIPTKAYAANTFLFTMGLTGCSVIVTRLDNNTYRIFHDSRMDSAVLYNNVQMRVDFNNYRISGRYLSRTGNAITLMLFQGGAWKMFLQRQLLHPDTRVAYNAQTINGWKTLHSAIKSKIDIYHQDPKRNTTLKDTYDHFMDDNSASEQIDKTWIWLQIKKNRARAQQH